MQANTETRSRTERVEQAIVEIRAGKMVILVDDEDRENEGDLTMAASAITPEAINFMAKYGRGLICLTLTEEKADALELPLQARKGGGSPLGTAFTVSIEARRGVSTGISAHDRAVTIKAAVAKDARPDDLVTPGHVFPLRAKRGGVLVRTGQTEGSVDLARLAGMESAGVICEIMNDDGSMARMPELEAFAQQHGLVILSIADLIDYRLRRESLVEERASAPLRINAPTPDGWRSAVYASGVEPTEYLALVFGDLAQAADAAVLVRVQSACVIGDVFGSQSCDCRAQLDAALAAIEAEGRGVLLYVYPVGRRSLVADFRGHVLHEDVGAGRPREEKLREFGLGAQVLRALGLSHIRLLTNSPKKIVGLEGYGLTVDGSVPIEVGRTRESLRLIERRREREGYDAPAPAAAPAQTKKETA